jgi:hypothetical protein
LPGRRLTWLAVPGPTVISLRTLLEFARDADSGAKRASGNVRSFDALFEPETVACLDRQHQGVYALLLFHPVADAAIAGYLATGALSSDSGPRILTFFTSEVEARAPLVLPTNTSDVVRVDHDDHPAYVILRTLFEPKPRPALPGILFMGGLDIKEECVYVPLPGLTDKTAARTRIAGTLALAGRAVNEEVNRTRFADDLAVVLRRAAVRYHRSGRTSIREFLISAFRVVIRHRGDIVTGLKMGTGKP